MSAVAKFLQGKVDESLTKLVQPAGLVPAAVFVLLNLAFVYPALTAAEVGYATAFGALDETWQAVTVAVVILFLGYLLLSVSANVLDLLAGDSWRHAWLYGFLQDKVRERLKRQPSETRHDAIDDPRSIEALGKAWELRSAYPVRRLEREGQLTDEQVEDVGPTSLGNAIRASHALVFDRYSIDLVALWPQLEASTDKDAPAIAAATDAKASLDMLANLVFVLGVFGVEGLAFFSTTGDWSSALLSLLSFPVAYIVYRAATAKARAWGDTVETVVDLAREDLRKKLDLREHTSAKDERQLWEKTSKVFLWGRDATLDADEIFDGKPAEEQYAATITASKNVGVIRHAEDGADVPGRGEPAGRRVGRDVEYLLVVSREGDGGVSDAVIALRDKDRTPRIRSAPPATATASFEVVRSGSAPDSLVITVPRLRKGAAAWLAFTLPMWEALVPAGLRVTGKPTKLGRGLDLVVSGSASELWLEVFASPWASQPGLLVRHGDDSRREPSEHDGRHHFRLTENDLGKTLRVVFDKEPFDEE